MIRLLDLFSGIGGFSLAAQNVWKEDLQIVAFVEKDAFCQAVLMKHWPNVPIIEDVRNETEIAFFCQQKTIDILTGGFPCQPFSQAGKRIGRSDDRYLWPSMLEAIRIVKPTWVVAENVRGILSIEDGMVFERVCSEMEDLGFEVQTFCLPACGVNAKHRRDRIFIVADSSRDLQHRSGISGKRRRKESTDGSCVVADSKINGIQGDGADRKQESRSSIEKEISRRDSSGSRRREWIPEPELGRVADGIPCRVDRLRGLGNAIVPQVAEAIFRAIKESEEMR